MLETEKLGKPFPMRNTCSRCGKIKALETSLKDFQNHPLLCNECVEALRMKRTASASAVLRLTEEASKQVNLALAQHKSDGRTKPFLAEHTTLETNLGTVNEALDRIKQLAEKLTDDKIMLRKEVEHRIANRELKDTRVVASEDAHRQAEDEWFLGLLEELTRSS